MTWKEILEKQKGEAQPEAVGDEMEQPTPAEREEARRKLDIERRREMVESRIQQMSEPRWKFFSTGGKKTDEEETE